MSPVRVLIVEDHSLVAEAFTKLLEPEFQVVGTAGSARELLRTVRDRKPDVVLLDLYLPGMDGMETGGLLKQILPDIKIIVVTVNDSPKTALRALNSWASGYLLKRSLAAELLKAVREVARGGRYITPALGEELQETGLHVVRHKPERALTARQREVLKLLASGCTMKEAAAILHVTARTVAFHKYRIMRDFGVKTNTQLLQFAMKERVLSPN